jgi:hypothetical protein
LAIGDGALGSSVNRSGALSSGDFSSIILSLFTDVFLVVISIVVDKIPTEYVSLTFCLINGIGSTKRS